MAIFRFFFQDGGCAPSWICNACVGTTHERHLVFFIIVQNLVGIDALVLIILHFRFREFGLKTPIHTPKLGFWGFWPPKWEAMWTKPKRDILARVRVVWAIMRENPSTNLTCRPRWVPKKSINENNFGYISSMCPEALPWTYVHLIWHSCRGRRRNHLWQFFGDRLRGVYSVGVENCPFLLTKPVI